MPIFFKKKFLLFFVIAIFSIAIVILFSENILPTQGQSGSTCTQQINEKCGTGVATECCLAGKCLNGFCRQCGDTSEKCTDNSGCCNGLICSDKLNIKGESGKKCVTCDTKLGGQCDVNPNQSDINSKCCYGQCVSGVCREVAGSGGPSCRTIGSLCSEGKDCCSQVCNGGKCDSCSNYCQGQGYDDGSCNLYSPASGFYGLSKIKSQCSNTNQCLTYDISSGVNAFCPINRLTSSNDFTNPSGGSSSENINLCYCSKVKQQDCSPECGLRCSEGGCKGLETGFIGCQLNGDLGKTTCSWNLAKGLNLISFPATPSLNDFKNSLIGIKGKYEYIQFYNNHSNAWENYAEGSALDLSSGYLIEMKEPAIFKVAGAETYNNDANKWLSGILGSVAPGWHLINFPFTNNNLDLRSFFAGNAGLKAEISKIYWIDWGSVSGQESDWVFYLPNTGAGSLSQLSSGKAYWFFKSAVSAVCYGEKCGKGWFNLCDATECQSLGSCYFEQGFIAGKCLPKCVHDSNCSNKCLNNQFASCDLASGKCGCEDVCTDTDKGKDYSNFGSAGGKKDFCKNDKILVEYYCEQNRVKSEDHTCDYGCQGGFCKTACTDTDGGKNSETFGTITNGEKTFSDKCESDNKTISEYYCNNDKSLAEQPEKYLCPFGCFNGACFLSADKIRKANISLIKLSDWGSINGVTVVIANDNSSSELSCLTQGGSCSVNLTPGKYQVFTRDTFFCSKEEGCFKDFELDGTRDIAVSLPVTLKPKSQDMCTETDKRLDYFTKGAVKIWRSPLMLSPIIDYCSLNGRTLNEYYCDGTGYKVEEKDCSGDISSFGSGGCFDGACLRDCTLENSPGYFCGDEQQIEARCGQKDLLKTIEIIKKKVPAGQKCNKAGASICAFCVASCKADNECLNLNCPTASKAKCGSDNKCLCEDQKRCSESSDCGDLKCDQGFEARCGVEQSVQVCFCYQLTSEKYIRFKIRDSISYSLIRGVNVQIIDKKNNNKAVASCVTDQDGRCNIETLNFSSKNQYFVETKNVNQYENFEQEILPENNGRTIFFDIDLVSDDSQDKPDSCSDDSDCDRITCSGANEPACNLQDEKCECVAVEGRLTNVANCADKYGKGYFCSTWADWIDKCGYNNSAKRSLRGIVVCNNNENMSCVTCNEVNSPDTANDCVKRYGAGYSCFTRSDWVNKCDSSDPSLWKSEFICDTNDANKACAACDRTNVVSPVTPLIGSDETSFTIKLYPGADLISSPFNGYPLTIQNLKDAGCILKTNSSFADKFIIYENSVLIPTGQIGLHQAAFVEITNECTVVKKGILPQQSSTFSLSKGLNIFSVALGVPLNQALGSCSGKVLSINSINNQTMGLYSVGNNDTLTPGQGYWIKVSEDCNLNLK